MVQRMIERPRLVHRYSPLSECSGTDPVHEERDNETEVQQELTAIEPHGNCGIRGIRAESQYLWLAPTTEAKRRMLAHHHSDPTEATTCNFGLVLVSASSSVQLVGEDGDGADVYEVGDAVEARWKETMYYPGKIAARHDDFYTINYDDGTVEENVGGWLIRRQRRVPRRSRDAIRREITAFYERYNPAKLEHIDKLLEKGGRGNEEALFEAIQRKYHEDVVRDDENRRQQEAEAIERRRTKSQKKLASILGTSEAYIARILLKEDPPVPPKKKMDDFDFDGDTSFTIISGDAFDEEVVGVELVDPAESVCSDSPEFSLPGVKQQDYFFEEEFKESVPFLTPTIGPPKFANTAKGRSLAAEFATMCGPEKRVAFLLDDQLPKLRRSSSLQHHRSPFLFDEQQQPPTKKKTSLYRRIIAPFSSWRVSPTTSASKQTFPRYD